MASKGTSWGWIIFWLIIFWPVGLYLDIKKMSVDKSAMMSGKTSSVSINGWILVVFGVIGLLGVLTDPSDIDAAGVFIGFALIAGGVLLLLKTSKIKKTAIKYKNYIDIVINHEDRSIDNISSSLGLSYDIVLKELQNMIEIGYLRDAYIHHSNREIVFKKHEPAVQAQSSMSAQGEFNTTAVQCPGCGANNVIVVGRVTECEFCGTPIKA